MVGRRGRRRPACGELPRAVRRRQAERVARGAQPLEVPVEQERLAAVDPQRLERRRAAQERLVVGAEDRLGRDRRGRARRRRPRAASRGHEPADGGEQRPRLDPRLLDLLPRGRSPRRSRRRPRGGRARRRPRRCGSSARGRSRRSRGSSRSRPSTRRGRPARARAMWSIAEIFGAPVIEPPGNVACRISARPVPGRSRPSTVETRCVTPGQLALRHQLRPAHRARLADAREVVALEVDDHHVLGRVLLVVDVLAERARALDRHRHEHGRRAGRGRARARRRRSPSPRPSSGAGAADAAARARRRARAGRRRNGALRCCTRFTW